MALLLKNALFLLAWGYSQETTKMPWFGSRLQDVVDFLLVVKERNMRERAKIVTREESDRRFRVSTVPGKMLDYSLSWGVEAHERFQLQCSDWVNCFWHLDRWWWFTVISPPDHVATKKSTGDELFSGEIFWWRGGRIQWPFMRGGERTRLQSMWPGLESRRWRVEFVVGFLFCSKKILSAGVLQFSHFVKNQSFRFLFDLHVNVSK